MKNNIYTVKDSCAGFYQRPFTAQSDGAAMREFADIAKDREHPIGKHPEHYSLWRLGTFNDVNGEIAVELKECLAHAHDLLTSETESPGLTA